jgi:hypothetical protein
MSYKIKCRNQDCQEERYASNIVDLIDNHTDSLGRLKCIVCGNPDAYIYQESPLQEKGGPWKRWTKGVIRIKTQFEQYSPYVFLSSDKEDGDITDIQFNYYKDTRPEGGRLKHGHGPGGSPALNKEEILQLLEKLISYGCMSFEDIKGLSNRVSGSRQRGELP